jgi:hypothetical protein
MNEECLTCGKALSPGARFCPKCGMARHSPRHPTSLKEDIARNAQVSPEPISADRDVVHFRREGLLVTSRCVTIGDTTFSVGSITAVAARKARGDNSGGAFLGIVGAVMVSVFAFNVVNNDRDVPTWLILGFLLLFIYVLTHVATKPTWWVHLEVAGREYVLLKGKYRQQVDDAVAAIRIAMTRG